MIPDIIELNFPKIDGKQYATLTQATCTLQDMGEKSISAQVKIDGAITPDFSSDWEVEFKGEKYIMPLRTPQAAKENTSLCSTIDLTFQHWAVYQLKRWMFFTVQSVASGTATPDKYVASVNLNLRNFTALLESVLEYYYGDSITIDLNPDGEYAEEPVTVEISYSYIWDVLIKIYELFGQRWCIVPNGDTSHYTIKIGYAAQEVGHIFEYGFEGGLLKVERQVQSEDIRNMLLGRGGEKNLPYRHFKDVDPQNPEFRADPDWIPELRNIYFSELRGKTFRDYIKGWKTNPHRQLTEADGTPIKPYGSDTPIAVEPYDTAYAAKSFAYRMGHTDERFNPVEYVQADGYQLGDGVYHVEKDSISRYGKLLGGLENNEEIYPTIQGVDPEGDIPDIGRVDEAIAIEQVTDDDVEESTSSEAQYGNIAGGTVTVPFTFTNGSANAFTAKITCGSFRVSEGLVGNVTADTPVFKGVLKYHQGYLAAPLRFFSNSDFVIHEVTLSAIDSSGASRPASALPPGVYTLVVNVRAQFTGDASSPIWILESQSVTASVASATVAMGDADAQRRWAGTFNVWIKNIWQTQKQEGESDAQYRERVWRPILGDREGNEAKVVFSDGWLSTSEDYEFTIVKGGVAYDTSKSLNGVASHWRLTLAKSDADLESTGKYVPSTMRQGNAGDHFFFIGIDMPHLYVLWAEERLDRYKINELDKVSEIKPTWVVKTDRIRLNNYGRPGAIAESLVPGSAIHLADKRFILSALGTASSYETLYLQSATYTYREPSSDDAALNPDVEMVLSDSYEATAGAVERISGSIETLHAQIGELQSAERILRNFGDRRYLRKDGLSDRSMSPTEFASLVTSQGFRNGIVGGTGWGFFKDENGNWTLEADRINVRQEMQVNSLVINQIIARGGMIVESAATIEVSKVVETEDAYVCLFDQKDGSVANLFQVGDVAYCSRFTPDNAQLKFYKRRVVEVGEDYISLSNGYPDSPLPDGWSDSGVKGSGVPEAGDVIVQFGSYTNPDRRYVKVRDVIGGGYERYIEGLDSVNADGVEYYFTGRQSGMYGNRPRWFIGNRDAVANSGEGDGAYIEFREGKFTLNNVELSVGSKVGDKTVQELLALTQKEASVGTRNLLLNSRGPYQTPAGEGDTPPLDNFMYLGNVVTTIDLVQGETYTIRAVSNGQWTDNHESSISSAPNDKVTMWLHSMVDETVAVASDADTGTLGGTTFVWTKPTGKAMLRFNSYGKQKTLKEVMLVRGSEIATEWTAAPEDFEYLAQALANGNTMIDGGLILTSLLRLGQTVDGGFLTMAGVSGVVDADDPRSGIAFWSGGDPMEGRTPTFAIFHNGEGYAANKVISFNADSLGVGSNVVLDRNGLKLFDSEGKARLKVANEAINEALDQDSNGFSFNTGRLNKSITVKSGSAGAGFNTTIDKTLAETIQTPFGEMNGTFEWEVSLDGALNMVNGKLPDYYEVYWYLDAYIGDEHVAGYTREVRIKIATTSTPFKGSIPFSFPIAQTGAVRFVATAETRGTSQGVGATLFYRFNGSAEYTYENRTVLGNDGLLSKWGSASLMVKSDSVTMLNNLYGLRVGADGFYYKDATHSNWTKWNPAT